MENEYKQWDSRQNKNKYIMKPYFIIAVSAFILISCVNKATKLDPINPDLGNMNTIEVPSKIPLLPYKNQSCKKISIPSKPSLLYLDSLISEYEFIPLETKSECLLMGIDKLLSDSSFIFILDKSSNSVFRFNSDGKFLNKIGSIGRGPGEYSEVYSITLNKDTKQIVLLDLLGRKLLFFGYEGNFEKSESMYYLFSQFEFFQNQLILFTSKAYNTKVKQIDLNQIIISKIDQTPLYRAFPYPNQQRTLFSFTTKKPLIKSSNEIYFHTILNDTIWQIDTTGFHAAFELEFQGRRKDYYQSINVKKFNDNDYQKMLNSAEPYFFGDYQITKDFVFLSFSRDNRIWPLFYCRTTGNTKSGIYASPKKDSKFNSSILLHFALNPDYILGDESFCQVIEPYMMKSMNLLEGKDNLSDKEKDLVNSLKEEDNPVLLKYKIKQF